MEIIRVAVAPHSRSAIATIKVMLGRPIDIVRDYQIKQPVVVVVKPRRTRRPSARVLNPRMISNVGKCTVTIIVIENAPAIAADEKIGKRTITEVAHSDSHSK